MSTNHSASAPRVAQLNWYARAALLGTVFGLTGGGAAAQDSVWIGGTSTWYDPAGWQGGVPNSMRGAFIDNGGVVRHVLSIPARAGNLTLGSDIGGSGTVQVTSPEPLEIDVQLIIGDRGTGTLTISGVGAVDSANAVLGNLANSQGAATVTGAGSSWIQKELTVGLGGAGTVLVQSGGSVSTSQSAFIGKVGTGDVTVTGLNSVWNVNADFELEVGHPSGTGTGTLTIADLATVNLVSFGSERSVRINPLSAINIGSGGLAGTLVGDTLINNGALNFDHTDAIIQSVSISGTGAIAKSGAGSTTLTNASAFTGTFTSGGGELILQGSLSASLYAAATDSTLRFDGSTVNMSGVGAIRSTGGTVEYSGATVNGGILRGELPGAGSHTIASSASNTRFNGVTIQNSVELIQDGAANFNNVIISGRLTNNAFLFVDVGTNTSGGHIIVNDTLNTQDFTNNGQITVNAGGSLFHRLGNLANGGGSRTTVNAGGIMVLMDGSELDLNGALLVNDGNINGTVNVNYGSLATGAGSYGVVNVNQGGVFEPGNSPGIVTAESLQFASSSIIGAPVLAIELGGTTPGSEHDQVNVTGVLALGGRLHVSLLPGFIPSSGDSFDLLDWGSVSGTFASINLPALTGLTWNTSELYTTGELSVTAPGFQEADFDEDGDVDGADFLSWQRGVGSPGTRATGDANDDGAVDIADLEAWQSQFGVPSAIAAVPVPEPGAGSLALVAGATLLWKRRRE